MKEVRADFKKAQKKPVAAAAGISLNLKALSIINVYYLGNLHFTGLDPQNRIKRANTHQTCQSKNCRDHQPDDS